jgi:hypothetical protein
MNILAAAGVPFTIAFHTFDGSQYPPVPAPIDSDYNPVSGNGTPYVSVYQNGVNVTSAWTVLYNPNSDCPVNDLVTTSVPNRYEVELTPPSGASGVFQIIVSVKVNSYEGAIVLANVQLGAPANTQNFPADYLSSTEQTQLGNAAASAATAATQATTAASTAASIATLVSGDPAAVIAALVAAGVLQELATDSSSSGTYTKQYQLTQKALAQQPINIVNIDSGTTVINS